MRNILFILLLSMAYNAAGQVTVNDSLQAPPPPPPPPPPPIPAIQPIFIHSSDYYLIRFPGCENMAGSDTVKYECGIRKMYEFFYRKLQYPPKAKQAGIEGIVKASFVVERNGSMTQPTIIEGLGYGCDAEVLRLINLASTSGIKWSPGRSRGRPVRLLKKIEIEFKLEEN